jgi:hypothetical protein
MLVGLNIYKLPSLNGKKGWVSIQIDKMTMTTTTDGVHYPWDAQTFEALQEKIKL